MEQIQIYVLLFAIVIFIGQIFSKSVVPISLILVITGMLLSLSPGFPQITLNPELVLNFFLPLLVYEISSFASWPDVKRYYRPIALLSVGHVIFITFLVAFIIHALIPQLGWPLAFVLGAVVSPPDDVAIVSIAKKIRMPNRIITILEGEGLLNDATALILFRFSLVAAVSHQFSFVNAVSAFFIVIIGETIYGIFLGYVLGELRLKIKDPVLHIMASILTPFLAYFPAEMLGGSGILATVVTGFIIGHRYSIHFSPDYRLVSFAVWPALSFTLQSILFLLVGLDLYDILVRISSISIHSIILYSSAVIATVILGRFLWVYFFVQFLPRFLFSYIPKDDPYPPWQYPFIVSWSGMRGGISLAAALAVPLLPATVEGANVRDLLIFLVFSVIAVTFVLQGLTLPWLLNKLGINKDGLREEYEEQLNELSVRLRMVDAALRWLDEYKELALDKDLLEDVEIHIQSYRRLKRLVEKKMGIYQGNITSEENQEIIEEGFLLSQVLEIERAELIRLWHEEKVSIVVRNKLIQRLDHASKQFMG